MVNNLYKERNGYKYPKTVGVIYSDVKRKYFPTKEQYITEKDAYKEAKYFKKYLTKLNIKTRFYPGNSSLPIKLKRHKPDIVINLVGSVKGSEFLSSSIPGILELLEIPYTGAGILGESIDYNKFLIKKLMVQNGIPVPNYQLFNNHNEPLDTNLRFPLISKLNEIHGAVELDKNCISENEKHLRSRLKYLIKTYKQPVLVEEFIVGKEVTAVVLEGFKKKVYLGEAIIKKKVNKYLYKSFEIQWLEESKDSIKYRKYKDPILCEYAKKAFIITDMADYGKFDIRIDQSGRYFFIDANSNPYIGPKETESPVSVVLDLYGISFFEILKRMLLNTVKDWKLY